jgi:SAM-dependent methyltransferase
MDRDYAAEYKRLYNEHWWWRSRRHLILEALRRCQPEQGAVLDIGCGDGLFFESLARFGDVEGIESDSSLVSPDSPHRDRIHLGAFNESFKPEKKYALILMLDVLEHMDDPQAALTQVIDLLQPNGKLVITVPAFPALWTSHDELNNHRTRYTKSKMADLSKTVGMQIDRWQYFFHALFFLKLAVRFKEQLVGSQPSVPSTHNRVFNMFFYIFSRLEQIIFKIMPLPFGSSLLVVGGKNNNL